MRQTAFRIAILNAVWRNGALNGHLTMSSFPMSLTLGGFNINGEYVMGMDLDTQLLLPPILNSCDDAGVVRIQVGDMFLGGTVRTFEHPEGVGDFAKSPTPSGCSKVRTVPPRNISPT